jgi:hypothetical protein
MKVESSESQSGSAYYPQESRPDLDLVRVVKGTPGGEDRSRRRAGDDFRCDREVEAHR